MHDFVSLYEENIGKFLSGTELDMNAAEFIVEITKAYGSILSYLWWPLVVLVIFFTLLFYFDRSIGSLGRRKKFPLTWKNMTQIVSQLERQYLTSMSPDEENKQRQMLVHDQIQRAKRGLERRDEQEVTKAIITLSTLGLHSDQQLPQQIPPDHVPWLENSTSEPASSKKS